jgi:asparagine synthase (glutamine-hydrolysing)
LQQHDIGYGSLFELMCGIAGYLSQKSIGRLDAENILSDMAGALEHRGPDNRGIWSSFDGRVGMAHQRLSIIDTTSAGNQPMSSSSGRYIVVFNGEIYNHKIIRDEINLSRPLHKWKSSSDTETFVEAFETFGISEALKLTSGMFSIAIWDTRDELFYLARDRFGEKPLYYGFQDDVLIFSSELKSLKLHPKFINKIDRKALADYVKFAYVPAPRSIYMGISKLEAGTYFCVSKSGVDPKICSYWSAVDSADISKRAQFNCDDVTIEAGLNKVLMNAVKEQMISDVPVGSFLSGGVDSSLITALMQVHSRKPIKTFTIGFNDRAYNEAHHAKVVAEHLGTDHTELYVSPNEAQQVIYDLPSIFCEPFADSSQIPTFLVSSLAKEQVTVALSGDGGDELFCGYNRYIFSGKSWNFITKVPLSIRKIIYKLLISISPNLWNTFLDNIQKIIPKMSRYNNFGNKIHKGSELLLLNSIQEVYGYTVSAWHRSGIVKQEVSEFSSINVFRNNWFNDVEAMMLTDTVTYLSDDILVKVDRTAMANSLETRAPFLNQEVYEFAWKIPYELKMRNGVGKSVLKNVLYNYVPQTIIDRPKMGFGIPLEDWLRGPLRDWAEELINEKRLNDEGFFHVRPIRDAWKKHLSGASNYQAQLWPILMFQAWLAENK